jgi:hypothetical protein
LYTLLHVYLANLVSITEDTMRQHFTRALALACLTSFGLTAQVAAERTFSFVHTDGSRNLQEIATVVRSTGDIRELAVDAEKKSLTMRGTADQAAIAEFLILALDRAQAPTDDTSEHHVGGATDDVVRIFYLPTGSTIAGFQQSATNIRRITRIPRAFTYTGHRALVVRASASQVAEVAKLVAALPR